MSDQELSSAATSALKLVQPELSIAAEQIPSQPALCPEAELLAKLRIEEQIDASAKASLEHGLAQEEDPVRLWYLLACLEHIPARSVATELVYDALCRLCETSSPLLRISAYRWLSGLFRIDLRFENRARLTLRDRQKVETAPMQQRLEQLLSIC